MNLTKKLPGFAVFFLLMLWLFIFAFSAEGYAEGNPLDVTVPVRQVFTVTGTNLTSVSGAFEYEMAANEGGNPLPAGAAGSSYVFTLDGTTDKNLSVRFIHAGVYTYTIKQIIPAIEEKGYTYDKEVFTVKVYVKNTKNGLLDSEVIIQNSQGTKNVSVIFTNAYEPLPTNPQLMVDPPVKKTVSGSPPSAATFEFKLTAGDSSYPMPTGSSNGVKVLTIVGAGEEDFGTWSYTAAGIYTYYVTEVNRGATGYTYDKEVYTIKDQVTDVNGQLVLTRTITNSSGVSSNAYAFTNVYKEPSNGPKTGDYTNRTLLMVIFWCAIVSAGVAAHRLCVRKRNDSEAKN